MPFLSCVGFVYKVVVTFHHKRSLLCDVTDMSAFVTGISYLVFTFSSRYVALLSFSSRYVLLFPRELLDATDSFLNANVDHSGMFV